MIISINNLKDGINWWLNKSYFPKDILNEEYEEIYEVRTSGVTIDWWNDTVDRLSQWRAIRARNPPNTKEDIRSRGKQFLNQIKKQHDELIKKSEREPSISDLQWEDIETLFSLASEIKPRSIVFAGKMCHFLFPKLFIVMDNEATNVFNYELYWRGMKGAWNSFNEKSEAIKFLTETINSAKPRPLHPRYPFETKIMELSYIGYKHNEKSNKSLQRTASMPPLSFSVRKD
jgi:hypothetical protein